ncbi:MAG TPA: FHA domain-containing protein [Polyangia bacterium]|nr:FHA domain-containing protein [Polyangia bacterium]
MSEKKKFRIRFLFQEMDLAPGEFFIGRSPSCNLTLEDPLVSRKHLRITVTGEAAVLDDLGSRNGTLVNDQPVFDGYRLSNRDRIRMGGHEMLFVEERFFHSRQLRPTGSMVRCPTCKAPFSSGSGQCPHCQSIFVPDGRCITCGQVRPAKDAYCSGCGTRVERRDDSTIPVELGGASAGWTPGLVGEVIEKAIEAGRHEQAASLLQGKIEDFERRAGRGIVDIGRLMEVSGHALRLAMAARDAGRVSWVIEQWGRAAAPMPMATLDALLQAASGWYDPIPEIEAYLRGIESAALPAEAKALIADLRRILPPRATDGESRR